MGAKDQIELGKTGEHVAAAYLESKGYRILERNWRVGREEIDIIAKEGDYVVIVEVKTRHLSSFPDPEVYINRTKQHIQARIANAWMRCHNYACEIRFDVIFVLIQPEKTEIDHITDAFYVTQPRGRL